MTETVSFYLTMYNQEGDHPNIRIRRNISDEDIPQVIQIINSIRQDSSPRNGLLFLWALHNSTDVSKNSEAWNKLLVKENINYLQDEKTFTHKQIAALKKQIEDDNIFGEYAAKHLDDELNLSNHLSESQQQDSMSFSEVSNRYLDLTQLRLARPITRDRLSETIDVKSLTAALVNDNSLRALITSPVNFECAVTEARNYLSAGGAVSINLRTIQTEEDRKQIQKYFEAERKERKVKFVDFNTSDPKQFLKIIQEDNLGYDAITTRPRAGMKKELIQAAVDNTLIHPLRFIGCSCVGFDHIDIESATENKVVVANSTGANSPALARLIVTQMEMLFRNVLGYNRDIHSGKWDVDLLNQTVELVGKTLGVIGPSASGELVIQEARKRGMKVLAIGRRKGSSERIARLNQTYGDVIEAKSLDELLQNSDVVSVHVPYSKETESLIGEKEIAKMKRGSFLIASATRGGVVNEQATSDALKSGHLRGAAFDVLETEKDRKEIQSPLLGQPNAILTPHAGCITPDVVREVVDTISRSIVCLNSGDFRCSVVNPDVLDKIEAPTSLRYDYENLVGRDLSPPLVPKGTGRSMHLVSVSQQSKGAEKILVELLNSRLQTPVTPEDIPVELKNSFSKFFRTQSTNWQR